MKKFKPTNTNIKKILAQWDTEIPESILQQQKQRQSRRLFLGQSVALIGGVATATLVSAKTRVATTGVQTTLSEPWLTVSAVQEHLFPRTSGEHASPGARDIHALEYLQVMLNTPDADNDERNFIINGVSWLDGVANNLAGHPFIKLNKAEREQVLKKISSSTSGENWLSTLLSYIFEALLTDPIYGGNTKKSGWQWLEHQAGFPRPPANKKYWMLDARSRKVGHIK